MTSKETLGSPASARDREGLTGGGRAPWPAQSSAGGPDARGAWAAAARGFAAEVAVSGCGDAECATSRLDETFPSDQRATRPMRSVEIDPVPEPTVDDDSSLHEARGTASPDLSVLFPPIDRTFDWREALRRSQADRGPPVAPVLGIDLGTTYACAAIASDDGARVLPTRFGTSLLPSAVYFAPSGQVLVGEPALRQLPYHPERTIVGSKRLVGRPFDSPVVQQIRRHFAYAIAADDQGDAAIDLDGEIISFVDVSALILRELRSEAETALGARVNRAVITCPAHYNERQRRAVKAAGEKAGLHVDRVLSEPTAAAMNHALGRSYEDRRVVVFDLGGGTFDVSLLEIRGEVFRVIASGGDTFLGGLDFDACIAGILVDTFIQREHIDPRIDARAIARMMHASEIAKRSLSERSEVAVELDDFEVRGHAARPLRVSVTLGEAEELFEPLVQQTMRIVGDVLKRARTDPVDVDEVILVGGQTRAPIVRRTVADFFRRDPVQGVHPEEAVALGASRYAARVDDVDTIILMDALPMSIGVGLPGGRYKKIIERDARLPAQRTYVLHTTRDQQADMEIVLFQGEDEEVAHNEPIGVLRLTDLSRGLKGEVAVSVLFDLNAECVLRLVASEVATGRTVETRLATRFTPDDIRRRLELSAQPTRTELERQRLSFGRGGVPDRPKGVWAWLTGFQRRGS